MISSKCYYDEFLDELRFLWFRLVFKIEKEKKKTAVVLKFWLILLNSYEDFGSTPEVFRDFIFFMRFLLMSTLRGSKFSGEMRDSSTDER